jgi:hypothetical protein
VLVVPVGAALVMLLVVVVVGAALVVVVCVLGIVVVAGGEVNVGPADAGKPTVPAVLCFCFGARGAAGCGLGDAAFGAGVAAPAGCGAEPTWICAAANL